jgi:hypothetical protein
MCSCSSVALRWTKKRLTAPPPETDAPTKEKALNLPEELDEDDEGTPNADEDGVEPEELEGIKDGANVTAVVMSEAKPSHASSSSRRREEGGREEAIVLKVENAETANRRNKKNTRSESVTDGSY